MLKAPGYPPLPKLPTPAPGDAFLSGEDVDAVVANDENLYVPVCVGRVAGYYSLNTHKVIDTHGVAHTPTGFECLGGKENNRKWRLSIRVLLSDGTRGKTLGQWLTAHNYNHMVPLQPHRTRSPSNSPRASPERSPIISGGRRRSPSSSPEKRSYYEDDDYESPSPPKNSRRRTTVSRSAPNTGNRTPTSPSDRATDINDTVVPAGNLEPTNLLLKFGVLNDQGQLVFVSPGVEKNHTIPAHRLVQSHTNTTNAPSPRQHQQRSLTAPRQQLTVPATPAPSPATTPASSTPGSFTFDAHQPDIYNIMMGGTVVAPVAMPLRRHSSGSGSFDLAKIFDSSSEDDFLNSTLEMIQAMDDNAAFEAASKCAYTSWLNGSNGNGNGSSNYNHGDGDGGAMTTTYTIHADARESTTKTTTKTTKNTYDDDAELIHVAHLGGALSRVLSLSIKESGELKL